MKFLNIEIKKTNSDEFFFDYLKKSQKIKENGPYNKVIRLITSTSFF